MDSKSGSGDSQRNNQNQPQVAGPARKTDVKRNG
jgi:hypothetical protein